MKVKYLNTSTALRCYRSKTAGHTERTVYRVRLWPHRDWDMGCPCSVGERCLGIQKQQTSERLQFPTPCMFPSFRHLDQTSTWRGCPLTLETQMASSKLTCTIFTGWTKPSEAVVHRYQSTIYIIHIIYLYFCSFFKMVNRRLTTNPAWRTVCVRADGYNPNTTRNSSWKKQSGNSSRSWFGKRTQQAHGYFKSMLKHYK